MKAKIAFLPRNSADIGSTITNVVLIPDPDLTHLCWAFKTKCSLIDPSHNHAMKNMFGGV